jgi:hypothetical protein
MMSLAASSPRSRDLGAASRAVFDFVLRSAGGSAERMPLSWGFYGADSDWVEIAATLACDGDPSPGAVDDALRLTFRAAERAASAATFTAEQVGWGTPRCVRSAGRDLSGQQAFVAEIVAALPKAYVGQLATLTGRSTRWLGSNLKGLAEKDVVRAYGPYTDPLTIVEPTVASRPILETVSMYPGVRSIETA